METDSQKIEVRIQNGLVEQYGIDSGSKKGYAMRPTQDRKVKKNAKHT